MFNTSENIINYGKYFASPQISVKSIRRRQDDALANKIIKQSLSNLRTGDYNLVQEPLFFVGSVDFMVKNETGDKTYYILEANGGNSRGFSALPFGNWQQTNDCYAESLTFAGSKNPVVLVGHPNKDLLLYEKILLSEHLVEKMRSISADAEVVHLNNLTAKRLKQGNLVIIGPYKDLLPQISLHKNNYVYFQGKQVDILIGDGIARRKPEIVRQILKKSLKSIVINDVFVITDDKALTYLAVEQAAPLLKKFNVEPIAFSRAKDRGQLNKMVPAMLKDIPEILIKPHGGSGGSGIDIISKQNHIDQKIESSIKHYHTKFGTHRNPYPYTVCQRVAATPIVWNDALHHFDIRIYVGRIKDRIVPLGALMRVALEPFAGHFSKKSFVVNLSGYEGVDTDRGFGLHNDSLRLFNLNEKDYASMFGAACTLIAFINNNYLELMKISGI